MKLEVVGVNLTLTPALHRFAADRFRHATGQCAHAVRKVIVRLLPQSNRLPHPETTCRIHAVLENGDDLIIEQQNGDLYAAINKAAGRFKHLLGEHVNRRARNRRP